MKPPKSSNDKSTLDLGSPYINFMQSEIEDNVESLLNKDSIIEHVGTEVLGREEYDSQFRVFLRLQI